MACQKCKSVRVACIGAKCSDLCFISLGGKDHDGYMPRDMGIGGGDYVEFELCLECGQVQGTWPQAPYELENK